VRGLGGGGRATTGEKSPRPGPVVPARASAPGHRRNQAPPIGGRFLQVAVHSVVRKEPVSLIVQEHGTPPCGACRLPSLPRAVPVMTASRVRTPGASGHLPRNGATARARGRAPLHAPTD